MTDHPKLEAFIRRHGLCAAAIDVEQVLGDFRREMDNGLAGRPSSLEMIPAFLSADRALPVGEPAIVVDAGGTNLRIAAIHFSAAGEPVVESLAKYRMPGLDQELSAAEFHQLFAAYLAPVIDRSDRIGFCFSYPAEIYPDHDGRLIRWTKGIRVPGLVDTFIGKGLIAALGAKGKGKRIALLNDTIATLLAGKASGRGGSCSSFIGFILGTGTNTAYIESNANILKRTDLDISATQAINVESGNFALAPRGDIDIALDGRTASPGVYTFEKMISGLYRGGLVLLTAKRAAGEGLLSAGGADYIGGLDDISAHDVDLFLLGRQEGPLGTGRLPGDDAETLHALVKAMYDRCAKLTALNIAAAALKSGAGQDPARPIFINIDGSTYYKSVGFREMVESYLKELLGGRGISYETGHIAEAPLIGAAVAGLLAPPSRP